MVHYLQVFQATWSSIALPLVITANVTGAAALIYSRKTRHKMDELIKSLSKDSAK